MVEEDPYLRELVRYLHLNPLRAKLTPTLRISDRFPWTGHSALLGTRPRPRQDTQTILAHFGPTRRRAMAAYQAFVAAALRRGREAYWGDVRALGSSSSAGSLRRHKMPRPLVRSAAGSVRSQEKQIPIANSHHRSGFKGDSPGSPARMRRYLFPSVTLLVVHVLGAAAEVAAASGVSVERKDAELRIVWHWFHLRGVGYFLVIFGLLAGLYCSCRYLDKYFKKRGVDTFESLLGWGGSIILIAGIAFASYGILQQLLNRTVIDISPDRVTVYQGPLPRWSSTTIATSNVEQFFSEMHSFRTGGVGYIYRGGSRTWIYFQARLKERRGGIPVDQILFSGVLNHELDPAQALFVEEQIERFLGIEDRPVGARGEIRR